MFRRIGHDWILKRVLIFIFFPLFGIAFSLDTTQAQTIKPVIRGGSGVETQSLTNGKVLAFSKGPTRRNVYMQGSYLHIQLYSKKKVKGYVNIINDTAVMIGGRYYAYDSIMAYFVPMRLCLIFGSALCIAGGGYMLLDGINGAINGKHPVFHTEALAVGIPLFVAGAAMVPFKEVKRKTSKWKLKMLDLYGY
ncbi:MAG: hypothetical protein RRX93_03505 [Bacteroidales bacterium]